MTEKERKIIHVDMDAFFASVEQRDFPEYKNKPLIVGGPPDSRGVVATCSYEARKFGIHSAMSSSRAYRLCPQAIFVPPRFDAYKEASSIIHEVFNVFTEKVEPLSMDEAYLDVSDCDLHEGSASLIAEAVRHEILLRTQLTASAGVSYNKFLAKVASDINKPNGMTVITPEQGEAFVEKLEIGRFYGVGKVTEARLKSLGIFTGGDIKKLSMEECNQMFGKSGAYYYNICRGIDHREVSSFRERKSLGSETTFSQDLYQVDEMIKQLGLLAIEVAESLKKKELSGKTITLKVKYDNFEQITRSKTQDKIIYSVDDMLPIIAELLRKTEVESRGVRLLGITVSNFITGEEMTEDQFKQLVLFE